MWLDVEFELPEDGELVEIRTGRQGVDKARYYSDEESWYLDDDSKKKRRVMVSKWRRMKVKSK